MKVLTEKELEGTIVLNDDGREYSACGWVLRCPKIYPFCDDCGAADTGLLMHAEADKFWREFKPKMEI